MDIFSKFVKAIKKFNLINNGDKIAVGLSGGKDSLTLVDLFYRLKKTTLVEFEFEPILIDMFNAKYDLSKLVDFCTQRGVKLHIVKTEIYDILFNIRKEKNPCSLCSKLRKGQLISTAKELGCNKVALGHHGDDFVETFFMSLTFEARLSTFSPLSYLDRTQTYQIRPMVYIRESEIINYSKDFPVFENPCPADKHTKRQQIKETIAQLEKINKNFCDNVLISLLDKSRHQNFLADI